MCAVTEHGMRFLSGFGDDANGVGTPTPLSTKIEVVRPVRGSRRSVHQFL